jgi:hypothetical protein
MDTEQFSLADMLRLPGAARTVMPIHDELPPMGMAICQIDENP